MASIHRVLLYITPSRISVGRERERKKRWRRKRYWCKVSRGVEGKQNVGCSEGRRENEENRPGRKGDIDVCSNRMCEQ